MDLDKNKNELTDQEKEFNKKCFEMAKLLYKTIQNTCFYTDRAIVANGIGMLMSLHVLKDYDGFNIEEVLDGIRCVNNESIRMVLGFNERNGSCNL